MATRPRTAISTGPLSAVPAERILALLSAERRAWRTVLSWDVGETGRAVEQAARCGLLPGMAVSVDGVARGYLTHHATSDLFRLAGIHCDEQCPPEAVAELVHAVLRLRSASGRRVEGQLLAFRLQDALDAAIAAEGLEVVERSYLAREVVSADENRRPAGTAVALERHHLDACAELVADAHAGGVEARINASFRTREGARTYLRDMVAGGGCGAVHWGASGAVLRDGRPVAACLVTTIAAGTGHLPQVVVHPDAQRHGLGDLLMRRALAVLAANGYGRLTLGVSSQNAHAARWYRRLGFTEVTRFSAYCREAARS